MNLDPLRLRARARWGRPLGLLAAAALAMPALPAAAATTTYANLAFGLTTTLSGYTACNELRVDATGDFAASTKFVVYGVLNCPSTATGYTLAGSGYVAFDGTVNMAFFMSNGMAVQCPSLVNLAGTCTFHNAAGLQVGTATVSLK